MLKNVRNISFFCLINVCLFLRINETAPLKPLNAIDDDPETLPNLFEGDILLPKGISRTLALDLRNRKWPNGIVYYERLDARLFNASETRVILDSIKIVQDMVNADGLQHIQFIEKTTAQTHFVRFIRGTGCYSMMGYLASGAQPISLDFTCIRVGTIQHEFMHTLGIYHEQSRPDRDLYISIDWNNIRDGYETQYAKQDVFTTTYGLPYDYGSIMHYGAGFFAIDRTKPVMRPLKANVTLGQRIRPSQLDIETLRRHYPSNVTLPSTPSTAAPVTTATTTTTRLTTTTTTRATTTTTTTTRPTTTTTTTTTRPTTTTTTTTTRPTTTTTTTTTRPTTTSTTSTRPVTTTTTAKPTITSTTTTPTRAITTSTNTTTTRPVTITTATRPIVTTATTTRTTSSLVRLVAANVQKAN